MVVASERKQFKVGTSGWTASDLDDSRIERQWLAGRFEIVEGVLTEMPPAQFDGGSALLELLNILHQHVRTRKIGGQFSVEVDLVLAEMRVPRADAVYLTRNQLEEQRRINKARPRSRGEYGRVRIAPFLVIESVSPGHEAHDQVLKRRWYGDAGVQHYWLLNGITKSLTCLILHGDKYEIDQQGRRSAILRPSAFPGLILRLGAIWS